MKKILLPLFVGILSFTAHAQIENGGFENWNELSLFQHPYTGTNALSSNYDSYYDSGFLSVTKVATFAAAGSENYALHVENTLTEFGEIPGYFAFAEMENDVIIGGIPINDPNMIGLSMDLNSDLPEGQQGTIIIQFFSDDMSSEGEMQQFVMPFSGQSNWSNVDFMFDEPIMETATQYVLAILAFSPFGGNQSGSQLNNIGDLLKEMTTDKQVQSKGVNVVPMTGYVEVDNIEFLGSGDVIPGADFELWTTVKQIVPENCFIENPLYSNLKRSTNAYSGNYAVELTTKVTGDYYFEGFLLMGDLDDDNYYIPNIEIGDTEKLSFMYSSSAPEAEVYFTFFVETESGFEEVFGDNISLDESEDYSRVIYDFASALENYEITATHMVIEFYAPWQFGETIIDNNLFIDEVKFLRAIKVVDVDPTSQPDKPTTVSAFPNPTAGKVILSFDEPSSGSLELYNITGAILATQNCDNQNMVTFDLSSYPAGLYTFKFNGVNGTSITRVVNQ